jgi:hypothetical protein
LLDGYFIFDSVNNILGYVAVLFVDYFCQVEEEQAGYGYEQDAECYYKNVVAYWNEVSQYFCYDARYCSND